MIVGLDGDIVRYEIGSLATSKDLIFDEWYEKPWPEQKVFQLVDDRVSSIIERSGASEVEVYLTGPLNFRIALATIAPYKGGRSGDKPYHWETVSKRLKDHWNAKEVLGIEADDMLAIRGTEMKGQYIIASRDKDLRQVPGLHYSWQCGEKQPEKPTYEVDEVGVINVEKTPSGSYKLTGYGKIFFYGQLLVGDRIDNIVGCPRVGPVKAYSVLNGLTTEKEMLDQCMYLYEQRYGDEAKNALIENARLLHLIRDRSWVTEEALSDKQTMFHVNKFWEIPNEDHSRDESTEKERVPE